jgi:putative methionine-R-sulfoxide reductase with GAF domain
MAQHPTWGDDPSKPVPTATGGSWGQARDPAPPPNFESDLAELTAKFTAQSGGGLSLDLSADLALQIVLNEIVEQACLVTGATGAAIVLERDGEMVCRASNGETAPELGSRLDVTSGLSGLCLETRQVQRCDDAQADTRADAEACRRLDIRSVIILPLRSGEKIVGLFEVFSSHPSAFGDRDEQTLEAFSQRVLKNLESASKPSERFVDSGAEGLATQSSILERSVLEMPQPEAGGDYASTKPMFLATQGETNVIRRIDLITWSLGVAVLACAVLLGVLAGERLGWGRGPARRRATIPVSLSSRQQTPPAGSAAQSATPGNQSGTNGPGGPNSSSGDARAVGSGPAAASRHTSNAPPPGSLLV